jgi:periplasmic protein TonB
MGKTTAIDRLIFTLLFSVIIHLTIVLGVSFTAASPPTNQPLVNLEITLVKQQTDLAPEQADFLAQANNEGGGETDIKSPEPTPDAPLPIAEEKASLTQIPQVAVADPIPDPTPKPEPIAQTEITAPEPVKQTPPEPVKPKAIEKPPAKAAKVITQAKAKRKVEKTVELADKKQVEPEVTPPKPQVSARTLKLPTQSEIALLEKQFDASTKALSKRPKKRRISAATKEYSAAAYMKSWEMKVERIGNFNYPQEAKRQGLNGSLMLSVDINPDGSVPPNGIVISRSSGYDVLDNAAVKIVKLGAPYSAIPDNVLQGNDMLTIIRTWKFETSRGLSTR